MYQPCAWRAGTIAVPRRQGTAKNRLGHTLLLLYQVGLSSGTTHTVSPTINAESPTSVTPHGTPQAIASPTTFEKLSPPPVGAKCKALAFRDFVSVLHHLCH